MAWQWHQRVEDCSRVRPQVLCLRTGYCLLLVAMVIVYEITAYEAVVVCYCLYKPVIRMYSLLYVVFY